MSSASAWAPGESCCTSIDGYGVALYEFTLGTDSIGELIETTSDVAITVTLTADGTEGVEDFPYGSLIHGFHHGAGILTFEGAGVTIKYPAAFTAAVAANSPWTLIKSRVAASTWILYGYLVLA